MTFVQYFLSLSKVEGGETTNVSALILLLVHNLNIIVYIQMNANTVALTAYLQHSDCNCYVHHGKNGHLVNGAVLGYRSVNFDGHCIW